MNAEAEYDLGELYEAYKEAKPDTGAPFAPWSLFKDAYGENARRHFVEALNNGDIEVYETKAGIRMDGQWPEYNTGRLWLEFEY